MLISVRVLTISLALAKKSVELLGGSIAAESELDKGTTFSVRIADFAGEPPGSLSPRRAIYSRFDAI